MTQCLNNPGDQEYEDHMEGCLDTFAKSMEGNKNTVVYVSAGMILGMVSILIFSYFAQWARKFKKVEEKNLAKSNKSDFFPVKLHFWQF